METELQLLLQHCWSFEQPASFAWQLLQRAVCCEQNACPRQHLSCEPVWQPASSGVHDVWHVPPAVQTLPLQQS